jgi:hypothetical protein
VKNASKSLRRTYKAALAGIEYNGYTLPVYEPPILVTIPDYFIEISSITESNEANDTLFMRETSINVEIFTRQNQYQNYDAVDEISGMVSDRILPMIGGNLVDNDFAFGHIQLESTRYLNERDTEGEYITRKILTFTQSLIQK